MYERFTDRSRSVIQLANREAKRLGHPMSKILASASCTHTALAGPAPLSRFAISG
jgi:hypothetical protein